ncbi:MAG: VWA domain-containing protein [Devosia sp.]
MIGTARLFPTSVLETIRGHAVERAVRGQRNRYRRSRMRSAANFDFTGTIRQNLADWDSERQVLVAERLAFMARKRRFLPWTAILCVDQSGSMTTGLIHAAVMAAVLSSRPMSRCALSWGARALQTSCSSLVAGCRGHSSKDLGVRQSVLGPLPPSL